MKHGYPINHIKNIFLAITLLLTMSSPTVLSAFPVDSYRSSSVLSSGRWVKIKVSSSNIHLITNTDLQRWGFSDPSKVRVYGYGGAPISDELTLDGYIDDLPVVPSEVTSTGLVFYAFGPAATVADGVTTVYENNYYSDAGYYFLTDSGEEMDTPSTGIPGTSGSVATSFIEMVSHEQELVSPGSTGHTFLGEDFSSTRSRTFSFSLPGKTDNQVNIIIDFAAKNIGSSSKLSLTANGSAVTLSGGTISVSDDDTHRHYIMTEATGTATVDGTDLSLNVTYDPLSGSVRLARLDRIIINYNRQLDVSSGVLDFFIDSNSASLSGADADTRLWDVTSPASIAVVNASLSGSQLQWTSTVQGMRHYVAWTPGAQMPSPVYVGTVTNQDIHACDTPHMVIITMPDWLEQAEEIADIHRNSTEMPLDVMVLTQEEVFNEFSSGTPDVNAFRKMFKMFYDRGRADGETDSTFSYALLLGRGIYDHRAVSQDVKLMNKPVLLQWQTVDGSHDNTSFTTEDYLAFLEDGSGVHPGRDRLCIAIGRIPVTSVADARITVDKIKDYVADDNRSDWKNRMVIAADDGDSGEHLNQMENVYKRMMSLDAGRNYLYTKIYIDAFQYVDNVAKDAHDRMFRYLNNGVAWWWFIGHANTFSWTAEGLLTRGDLEAVNFAHQPMLYASTCDFLRWDLIDDSGAEVMYFNTSGIIGAIAATRPVYIMYNKNMSLALASKAFDTFDNGVPVPAAEMLRRAKNTLLDNEENKLRYVFLGDPALSLATSRYRTVLDKINGETVDAEEQPTIMARQNVTMEGRVVNYAGETVTDFNGIFIPTVYDAEYSTTTLAHGDQGEEITFEEQGDRLYVGRDSVRNGRFDIKISMPSEIASNFRPAALNMYAVEDGGRDASGVNRDFFVYGFDDSGDDDTTPPVIEHFVLNSLSFRDGQKVNSSPTVIARVSDNIGINISSAGIGHQISLLLDGDKSYPDVAQYYTPGSDGPVWGTVSYPLSGLSDGDHSLRLRVWDTSNNLAESTISFTVKGGTVPEIISLYADASPAIDHVNFYVEHNLPDADMQVTLAVYDLMGRMVWSDKRSGQGTSSPMSWDLQDNAGRRVPRGIYVYRATVTADGEEHATAARKLAVAAE